MYIVQVSLTTRSKRSTFVVCIAGSNTLTSGHSGYLRNVMEGGKLQKRKGVFMPPVTPAVLIYCGLCTTFAHNSLSRFIANILATMLID